MEAIAKTTLYPSSLPLSSVGRFGSSISLTLNAPLQHHLWQTDPLPQLLVMHRAVAKDADVELRELLREVLYLAVHLRALVGGQQAGVFTWDRYNKTFRVRQIICPLHIHQISLMGSTLLL